MSALMDFLLENPVDQLTEEVVVSKRLKEFPVTIRPMNSVEFNDYQRLAARTAGQGEAGKSFYDQIVINHTVEPNFKDAEAIRKAGCVTPEQLLSKTLLAGEIAYLARRITALSGFGQTMEELVEEAKNS